MRLLLAVQRGDRAAVERAVDAETGPFAAGAPVAAPAAAATAAEEGRSSSIRLAPGCRAVVISLPKHSARHNGERCLVVRREGDLYGVCCDSGVALRLKPNNLKITLGAPLTTRDALWFACTLLPPDTINTVEAQQRREIVRILTQTAQLTTAASNRALLHRVDFPIGHVQTTPLLECCCAGAFLVAKELVSAFGRNANSQCSVPVGAGPAAGATPLLVACSYQPSVARCGDDGPSSDDDDEQHEVNQERARVALGEASLAGLASLVETLLEARAEVNVADQCGRTPALACIVNGQMEALKVLLGSDPVPRLDARCRKSGLSPLAAACVMGSSEMSHLVETAANAQGLMHLMAEERRAANTCVLMDIIVTNVEAEAERLDLPEHDDDSERTTAAILLMKLGIVDGDAPATGQTATSACMLRLERMLEHLEEDATSSDFSNPLEMAVLKLLDHAPAVHRKAWASENLVNSDDRAVLLSLQAAASAEETRPLLAQMPEPFLARAAGSESWLVSPECHRFK